MNRWANDKVRVNYMLGVGDKENKGYSVIIRDDANVTFDIYHINRNKNMT